MTSAEGVGISRFCENTCLRLQYLRVNVHSRLARMRLSFHFPVKDLGLPLHDFGARLRPCEVVVYSSSTLSEGHSDDRIALIRQWYDAPRRICKRKSLSIVSQWPGTTPQRYSSNINPTCDHLEKYRSDPRTPGPGA